MKAKLDLKLQKISEVVFRVLPNIFYDTKKFSFLYTDRKIKSYFKSVRHLNEYPGLYDIFKKNGFDCSLADQVRNEIPKSKDTLFTQIKEFFVVCTKRSNFLGLCKINETEIVFINSIVPYQIFRNIVPNFVKPSLDEVVLSLNLKASAGLPEPRVKKRDLLPDIIECLGLFFKGELKPSDVFRWPSVIFSRSQVRGSGLKLRVVHAVHAFQQSLETFYFIYFKNAIPKDSSICIGLTQLEIADVVREHGPYWTYSIDYKLWDRTRQPVLSVIAFEVLLSYLPLSEHQTKILKTLRALYLTLPSFHPSIELARRWIGTVSGSGFTTLDNSLCNLILIDLILFRYCKLNGLSFDTFDFKINVSGDDLLLSSKYELNFDMISRISFNDFGATMKLEGEKPSSPNEYDCYFLGSKWIACKPYRSEKLLVAGVIYGTGNFPYMTTQELFQSRFFELFGNSADCLYHWKRTHMRAKPRLFYFNELARPFKDGTSNTSRMIDFKQKGLNTGKDTRGFWFDFSGDDLSIASLWMSR